MVCTFKSWSAWSASKKIMVCKILQSLVCILGNADQNFLWCIKIFFQMLVYIKEYFRLHDLTNSMVLEILVCISKSWSASKKILVCILEILHTEPSLDQHPHAVCMAVQSVLGEVTRGRRLPCNWPCSSSGLRQTLYAKQLPTTWGGGGGWWFNKVMNHAIKPHR